VTVRRREDEGKDVLTHPQMPLHFMWTMHSHGLGSSSGDSPIYISWCSFVKSAGLSCGGSNLAISAIIGVYLVAVKVHENGAAGKGKVRRVKEGVQNKPSWYRIEQLRGLENKRQHTWEIIHACHVHAVDVAGLLDADLGTANVAWVEEGKVDIWEEVVSAKVRLGLPFSARLCGIALC
jgi:hypothetical protein